MTLYSVRSSFSLPRTPFPKECLRKFFRSENAQSVFNDYLEDEILPSSTTFTFWSYSSGMLINSSRYILTDNQPYLP